MTLVGASSALHEGDWVFWGNQICVPALLRNISLSSLFADALSPGSVQDQFAAQHIVNHTHGPAARLPHATGLAWAARQDGIAVLCEVGDRAVSDADFHVGVNFAAVMQAPVVFLVRTDATAHSVLGRAEGYGIRAVSVDGMDAQAVQKTISSALQDARDGKGPVLVEATVSRGTVLHPNAVLTHSEQIETALTEAERNHVAATETRG
jgi:pyruvate dehydrogenase E1 component alpha subunit